MQIDHLKPNVIVRGSIFPEPVQVITTVPMGDAVKLIGKGRSASSRWNKIRIRR